MKHWRLVHEWTSLACTLTLLVACLTGLPLIFADEIADMPARQAPNAAFSLDEMVARAGIPPAFVRIAADEDRVYLGPRGGGRPLLFALGSGRPIDGGGPGPAGPMDAVLAAHGELFAGLAGRLVVAAMGLCALVSILSGIMVYAPFAGSRPFGDVRMGGSRRLVWLDRHNIIGIVTAAWFLLITATGVMNAIEHPLFSLWRGHVPEMLPPVAGGPSRIGPDEALANARRAAPGMRFETIIFPGATPGVPGYFLVWGEGTSVLTARLSAPVAIDALSGRPIGEGALPMPWYLRLLDLSRPLHFGDYGGLPLKIIWALLDIAAILLLLSGLYLWVAKRRRQAPAEGKQGPGRTTGSAGPAR